ANVDPAIMNLGAAYLLLQEIDSLSDSNEIHQTIDKYKDYEAKYLERRAYWSTKLPDAEIKRLLETQAHPPAAELLRIAREEYLPLVAKGKDAHEEANKILIGKIRPLFFQHRNANMQVVEKLRARTEADEQRALEASAFWTRLLIITSIVLVVVMGVSGWW